MTREILHLIDREKRHFSRMAATPTFALKRESHFLAKWQGKLSKIFAVHRKPLKTSDLHQKKKSWENLISLRKTLVLLPKPPILRRSLYVQDGSAVRPQNR